MPVGQQSATAAGVCILPRLRSTSWPHFSFSIETELVVPEIAQTGLIRSLSRGQMLTASVAQVVVSGNASA